MVCFVFSAPVDDVLIELYGKYVLDNDNCRINSIGKKD